MSRSRHIDILEWRRRLDQDVCLSRFSPWSSLDSVNSSHQSPKDCPQYSSNESTAYWKFGKPRRDPIVTDSSRPHMSLRKPLQLWRRLSRSSLIKVEEKNQPIIKDTALRQNPLRSSEEVRTSRTRRELLHQQSDNELSTKMSSGLTYDAVRRLHTVNVANSGRLSGVVPLLDINKRLPPLPIAENSLH